MAANAPAKSRKKRVLIADQNTEVLRTLGKALAEAGFEVLLARDGSKALEASILKSPDLVLIEKHCSLIDAQRFGAILRANPRTENTPLVVLTSETDTDASDPALGYLEGFIQKPFNVHEVVSRVGVIAAKIDTAKSVRSDDKAIVGNLNQMSLVDLLQIFAMNRKTGTLALKLRGQTGEIAVSEGRLVDARTGRVSGTKALFRLLIEKQGEFSFTPGKLAKEKTLEGNTDSFVMEGMRQEDEFDRLLPTLPARDDVIERVPGETPAELAPVMQAVLNALSEARKVHDLFDAISNTDFEVAQALAHLITAKLVRKRASKDGATGNSEPVMPEALVFMLRSYMHRVMPNSVNMQAPRVLVVADDPRRVLKFMNGLQGIAEFQRFESGAIKFGYGVMGRLPLAPDLALELVALPMRMDLLPASVPLTMGGLGIICLSSGAEDSPGLERFREAMAGRISAPWLEVTVDPEQADVTFEDEPRGVQGILSAFCRALGKS